LLRLFLCTFFLGFVTVSGSDSGSYYHFPVVGSGLGYFVNFVFSVLSSSSFLVVFLLFLALAVCSLGSSCLPPVFRRFWRWLCWRRGGFSVACWHKSGGFVCFLGEFKWCGGGGGWR
jgi:hypothetical protein